MVSSKTIENLQWSLQNHWNLQWIPKKHWTCQWSSQINILLKQLNYPVVTITILIWLCCSKVYCQSSLIFIAAHCSYKPNLPHPTFCMLIYCTLVLVSFWIIYLNCSSVYDITFYALFRLNGSSKPSLTSKPLLTIALKILKTIEKPLVPMVGPPKKHSMVMVQLCQTIEKPLTAMVA